MNLLKKLRPRDIVTRKSLENAAAIVAATGGSTNAALHLPAIANEIGIKFDLMDVARIFKKTPYLASLKPGGLYVAKDMWKAGVYQCYQNNVGWRIYSWRLFNCYRKNHERKFKKC